MKKAMIYILISFVVVILIAVIIFVSNPLLWSNSLIKGYLLTLTPRGMVMEDVIKILEKHKKWEIYSISYDCGYSMQRGSPSAASKDEAGQIGKKSIRVHRHGRVIFNGAIVSYWGFDEDGKLVDLDLRKDWDTP